MVHRTRRPDSTKARTALTRQWNALIDYVAGLPEAELTRPSRVQGWSVGDLIAHLQLTTTGSSLRPAGGAATIDFAGWTAALGEASPEIDRQTRELAAEKPDLATAVAAAEAALAERSDDLVVTMRFGAMRVDDLVLARIVETVVHADDLDPAFPHDRGALAIAVRALADAFAVRVGGNAVELRVPPFTAVQCVAGPRHTRGTPPNVVEVGGLAWLRLTTGRLSWAHAVESGEVSASGERSDLSGYLPLMR